ncbi:IS3 family transposase [Catenulispora rubra]|uniref:IS3 family transposase n=1 Tax=Catenulispora rubra TaxID=280293 RepID=UPI0018920DA6|nr:IS3 family transposase [Catenulispora rubra]
MPRAAATTPGRAAEPARAVKASADQALTGRIRKIHQASRCTYGAKRVALDLADGTDGQPPTAANHKKVARLMRQHQIIGRHLRRRRALTKQDKAAAPVPDLLGRDFDAGAPDVKWCGDITYIPVGESGFVYLATVIDLFSGRLLGWSIADHHRAELVADALTAAVAVRGGDVDGVIFHSDRGSEYTSTLAADYCRQQGIRRSMGRVGSCFDNAAAESFFATYKRETVTTLATGRIADEAEARRETFRWIAFYNHRRRHSRAGRLAPITYEQRHHHDSKLPDSSATVQSLAA